MYFNALIVATKDVERFDNLTFLYHFVSAAADDVMMSLPSDVD